jgi:histidine ammonia-lyase
MSGDLSRRTVTLSGGALPIEELESVARGHARVTLDAAAARALEAGRAAMLSRASSGAPIYGVNTGFGSFANVRIDGARLATMQRNLILSHAAGVGEPLPRDVVRAMMCALAASLARNHSGVRAAVVESIVAHLNADLTPVVPSRGSVGASGDLAPLAHVALALIGEGEVMHAGTRMATAAAHAAAGIAPLALEAKEGLALINGTHLMSGIGALCMADAARLADAAIVAAAMAIDACRASDGPLDARIHEVRKQHGQSQVAARMRALLDGSAIGPSHREGDPRVQDPYALRAAPQVIGAAIDTLQWARGTIERELAAVTDNPLVFVSDAGASGTAGGAAVPGAASGVDVVSGANFHGMPMAIALDALKIALCHIAGIAERRIYWALSGHDRHSNLPPHLAGDGGVESGLMIVQYAAAACCNELRTLAYPSSVGNIPTCAGIEDYNSMGATSALHALQSVSLARSVVAAELLVMAQGLERQRPLRSGAGVERAHAAVRQVVPPLAGDRSPAPDIAAISCLIASGTLGN